MDKLYFLLIFAPILEFQSYFYNIQSLQHHIISDLHQISILSQEKYDENDRFAQFLKNSPSAELDQKVFELNRQVTHLIDCQSCGNCCKTLMIVVSEKEADLVAETVGLSRTEFDDRYLEIGSHGLMIMNQMPCSFLESNSCTIYEKRFEGCREFPALHLPNFSKRVFTHFMHYSRCPIIFNVIEGLKIDLNFEKEPS